MELRSPSRLRVRLRTSARSGAAAVASALLSGCFILAQHTHTPWASVDNGLRHEGDSIVSAARARTHDNVLVDVSVYDLPRSRNRTLRETLMRYGLIAKSGPSLVDWTREARRTLAPCPNANDNDPYIPGCRRLVVARLRTIALTSYTYDYTGFETGEAQSIFKYRFTAAPSNAIGRELARRKALTCSKWVDGEATPPDIIWTSHATCAGWFARIWHPTLGDAEFLDLVFNGLGEPSGVGDYQDPKDRF